MGDGLAEFNGMPGEAAERLLSACNAAPRFAQEVVAARPYDTAAALADTAERVARGLSWPEVRIALAAHPRIGERPAEDTAEARASRREQAAVTDPGVRAALEVGNRAYEERFGHVFLIRAAGRAPAEILTELRRRLDAEPAAERDETTGQLAEITRLRVERLVSG